VIEMAPPGRSRRFGWPADCFEFKRECANTPPRSSVLTTSSTPTLSLAQRCWQWFLLKNVEHRVSAYSIEQARTIRELFEAAELRHEAARDLLDRDDPVPSLELARSASRLYARAMLAARMAPLELAKRTPEEAWTELTSSVERSELPAPPAEFERAWTLLDGPDDPGLGRLGGDELLDRTRPVFDLLRWLSRQVEPRSLARVRHQQWRRRGLLVALIVGVVGWAYNALFALPNVALHQRVQLSSVHPNSTAAQGAVVDGVIDQSYGAHTGTDNPPWVKVDLGRERTIERVKIYNRGDGWFDDGLPFTLEFSDNDTDFTEVDKRTTSFGQFPPWIWTYVAHGKSARFVRVRGKPNGFVALSEIEVYGK